MSFYKFEREPAWRPKPESGKEIKKFMTYIENRYNIKFNNCFWDLHEWSIENIENFWTSLWDYLGIIHSVPYKKVIDFTVGMEDRPKWYEGAKLNLAENFLKHRDEHIALIAANEDGDVKYMSYFQLYEETRRYSAAFKKIGVAKGDVVACYMSNRPEAIIAMLAVISIGAIWTGGIPLLGSQAFLNRVSQVSPKVLITIDKMPHNKEIKDMIPKIKKIAENLPSLEKIIVVPFKRECRKCDIFQIKNSCFLDEFLELEGQGDVPPLTFEQVSFSHPCFVSYTSGTTGLPKTLVHGQGGLLTGLRDFVLHWNMDRSDNVLSMSPVGWVSWNVINILLFIGATITVFEGVPYYLTPNFLWEMTDKLKLTCLFITPSTLDELERRQYVPNETHNLSCLRLILSAGSIAKPYNFDFALQKIKKNIDFCIGYGCTEIMGFALVTEQSIPVYRGEINTASLGCKTEILDEEGNVLMGNMGHIVICTPSPSFPLYISGDTDGKIYKNSYFSKYPGKFAVGDSAMINPATRGIIICGRSDDTLKPKGCRFGSSEIYNIVDLFPEVKDSLCVSQYNEVMDERAVLFLTLKDDFVLNEELIQQVRNAISEGLSPRHVPEIILEAPAIPYNVNGKKMELIVKKIINNMPHNPESVDNSECLNFYYSFPKTHRYAA